MRRQRLILSRQVNLPRPPPGARRAAAGGRRQAAGGRAGRTADGGRADERGRRAAGAADGGRSGDGGASSGDGGAGTAPHGPSSGTADPPHAGHLRPRHVGRTATISAAAPRHCNDPGRHPLAAQPPRGSLWHGDLAACVTQKAVCLGLAYPCQPGIPLYSTRPVSPRHTRRNRRPAQARTTRTGPGRPAQARDGPAQARRGAQRAAPETPLVTPVEGWRKGSGGLGDAGGPPSSSCAQLATGLLDRVRRALLPPLGEVRPAGVVLGHPLPGELAVLDLAEDLAHLVLDPASR